MNFNLIHRILIISIVPSLAFIISIIIFLFEKKLTWNELEFKKQNIQLFDHSMSLAIALQNEKISVLKFKIMKTNSSSLVESAYKETDKSTSAISSVDIGSYSESFFKNLEELKKSTEIINDELKIVRGGSSLSPYSDLNKKYDKLIQLILKSQNSISMIEIRNGQSTLSRLYKKGLAFDALVSLESQLMKIVSDDDPITIEEVENIIKRKSIFELYLNSNLNVMSRKSVDEARDIFIGVGL